MSDRLVDIALFGCMGVFIVFVTILLFAPCLIISAGLYAWMAR